ncbi:glutathione S-transferase [Piscinibacter gummiphilus]|uniref:Glutathione S-transferase n=1 Tax=Piscinibacter gummiphilus TaxID=946333 RepID=A0ABZ0D2S0_9BURK|nr:glutathione S-transferase [Piscinibacter gummiphilus]WOB09029.1 glutathione S-transferase [Piscinibacter gummiphilus]
MTPIHLYQHPLSGHAHRVKLLLSMLDLPFEEQLIDVSKGEQRHPEFLALNPFGQVPVIQDGDITLADSNAILTYLALRYDDSGRWLPRDPVGAARVQRWLSVAAGQLVNGPGNARIAVLFGRPRDERCGEIAAQLFQRMEAHLATSPYLAAEHPTIADLALYSYTSHAPEGGVSLEPYPQLRAWLARIEALPGYVSMVRQKALA